MKKIAVIISQIEESCQSNIWDGIVASAKREGVELVTFVAYSLDSDDEIRSHYAMFKSFITEKFFDGVILFTGAMSEYTPWPAVKKYAESISLPLVTIAGNSGCGSNVVINNSAGIIEMVNHLVKGHNRQKIAFIGGPSSNEEAADRFSAYCEALLENGLDFDELLYYEGDFSEEAGANGVSSFLEGNVFFDAIICADDYTAIGAMNQLFKHRLRVPQDVSVIGFDDIPEAAMLTPALSTIQQPFLLQGEIALNTLVNQIKSGVKDLEPETILLNTHCVFRSSCGCTSEEIRFFRENWHAERSDFGRESVDEFIHQLGSLIAYQILELKLYGEKAEQYREFIILETTKMWHSFFDEIETSDSSSGLLVTLLDSLHSYEDFANSLTIWQGVLSNLTPFAYHFEDKDEQLQAGAILHEARIALDSLERRHIQISSYEKLCVDEAIRESCTKIITTKSQEELIRTIVDELHVLGFQEATLVIFNHYSPIKAEEWQLPPYLYKLAAITGGEPIVYCEDVQQITLEEFVENNRGGENSGFNKLFLPLYMNGEYFGFYIMDVIPDEPKELYSEIQIHSSSALKSCFMLDNLRALSMNDELTGLSNRRGFMLLANQLHAKAVVSNTDLLIFYFDMDNLKVVNDEHSHEDGDRAIRATASLLKRTFRNNDIIGRIGGDEFVAIIDETVPMLDRILKKRLRDLISTYNLHSGLPYDVDMSIGVATLSVTGNLTIEAVMKEADSAMFENKRKRKKGRL